MKNLKLAALTCAMVAVLAACSTPAPTTVIGFNYDVDNARANGIVQVFDLSGNTVVQVRDMNAKTTQFLDAKNSAIPFKIVGENAVLTGMHSSFTMLTTTAASRVLRKVNTSSVEGLPEAGVSHAPVTKLSAGDSDAAIIAEIARMRKELADLKEFLAAAARDAVPSAPAVAAPPAGENAGSEPTFVVVSFQNNSRQFNPAQDQRAKLMTLSKTSDAISIRGFTDTETSTTKSTALAKERAEAAKRYLVSIGVAPAKIVVSFEGAGNFIADNLTPTGRAANRRVEIRGS